MSDLTSDLEQARALRPVMRTRSSCSVAAGVPIDRSNRRLYEKRANNTTVTIICLKNQAPPYRTPSVRF